MVLLANIKGFEIILPNDWSQSCVIRVNYEFVLG